MTTYVETVIVGAGQAGLAVSYYLSQQDRPHVVLDRQHKPAAPGGTTVGIPLHSTLQIGNRHCQVERYRAQTRMASFRGTRS